MRDEDVCNWKKSTRLVNNALARPRKGKSKKRWDVKQGGGWRKWLRGTMES